MDNCACLFALDKHFSSIPIWHTPPEPVKALLRSIIDFQPVLHRPDKQVAFFGVFNAGKSTLLNAILGARLLPTNVNRATGVITKIGYASQPIADVVRVTSNDLVKEPIDFDHIAKYILLDLSSITSKAPEGIEAVSIGIPLSLLTKDIVLVDTPGLLDNPVLTERTYQEVERSDLAVMVLPADKLLSQVEKDAAKQVHEQLNGNIVFVINRLELVDQNERAEILDWAKTGLSGLGNSLVGQPNIFAIEAKKALASRQSNIHSKADSKQPFAFKSLSLASSQDTSGTYQPLSSEPTKKSDEVATRDLTTFEHWMKELFSGVRGEKIAVLSRLGTLEKYLAKAQDCFQVRLTEAHWNRCQKENARDSGAGCPYSTPQFKNRGREVY